MCVNERKNNYFCVYINSRMRVAFLLISVSILLFAGCKSKNSACHRCPYESGIQNILPLELPSPYLAVDSSRIDLNDILPAAPFEISELLNLTGNPLLPLYQDIIGKAYNYEGVRYRRGGASSKGMDCSGLVYTCYSAFGIMLPRSSADMAKSVYDISRNEANTGDLIFFKTNSRHGRINHVGLVIESNGHDIKFIHASIQRGVVVSSTAEDYYARTFAKVGRVLHS